MSLGTVLSSVLAIVLSLGLVLLIAWGALWLLRRFQDGQFGSVRRDNPGRTLRFTRTLPLGPRERLVLVEVDGEELLLGVTAHSIVELKAWPRPDGGAEAAAPVPNTAAPERPRFRLPLASNGPGQ